MLLNYPVLKKSSSRTEHLVFSGHQLLANDYWACCLEPLNIQFSSQLMLKQNTPHSRGRGPCLAVYTGAGSQSATRSYPVCESRRSVWLSHRFPPHTSGTLCANTQQNSNTVKTKSFPNHKAQRTANTSLHCETTDTELMHHTLSMSTSSYTFPENFPKI